MISCGAEMDVQEFHSVGMDEAGAKLSLLWVLR